MKNIFAVFVIIIFFLVGFFLVSHNQKYNLEEVKEVIIAGQNIKVDLALTEAQQAQGLSGRSNLESNQGMFFIFSKPGKYPFWMKDMNFPIDIIWLAPPEAGLGSTKVVYIEKDARPELYPETYGPGQDDKNALYVLEVVSGFADKNNLKIGDSVEFKF